MTYWVMVKPGVMTYQLIYEGVLYRDALKAIPVRRQLELVYDTNS